MTWITQPFQQVDDAQVAGNNNISSELFFIDLKNHFSTHNILFQFQLRPFYLQQPFPALCVDENPLHSDLSCQTKPAKYQWYFFFNISLPVRPYDNYKNVTCSLSFLAKVPKKRRYIKGRNDGKKREWWHLSSSTETMLRIGHHVENGNERGPIGFGAL